ncbi:MAG: sugar transferase [Alphaproteobacteria bacterium]|nr:sugar transferase [Alphaproteobacteria bacterium]MBU1516834.1 sugar transferase [Alphaproteobacteria bacterium]MBU2092528.1 sugar transferase [Alphaproteobacteria bacterium]MBU2151360.1 sugar transferase [Alphaproteobacteria bacterium]MBU2309663.1 sugar transferase [Alphaproteobacteria bacterium]
MEVAADTACANSRRKRAFDFTMALFALLVFLPLLLTIGMLVRLESRGPALFRQRRTGLHGRIFTVFKFRTMTVAEDGETVRQATRGDARITALGAILRKLSLDELPQLLNVLRGDMSLIGPRPHAVAHDEAWGKQVAGYERRFRARPGLTGYAAVCGFRGEVKELQAIIDRVESDNEYIDTWSFGLDLKIILRTLPLIFGDARAY